MNGFEWMLEAWAQGAFGILFMLAALAHQVPPGEARREGGRS